MVSTLAFVLTFIATRLNETRFSEEIKQAIRLQLIPAFFLQEVAAKTPKAAPRHAIEAVAKRCPEPIRSTESPWCSLEPSTLEAVERIAREWARLFQRSSAGVEGRHGYLARHHHRLHKIRPRRLQALTVVHNSSRFSGPTPAEQFFGRPHEDLFEWLASRLDLPGWPARKRPRPPAPPLFAAT